LSKFKIVSIVLIISLAANVFLFLQVSRNDTEADKQLKNSLNMALGGGFSSDIEEILEDKNQYYNYMRTVSALFSAYSVAPLTSYKGTRDELTTCLHYLYITMLEPAYQKNAIKHFDKINFYIFQIAHNPNDADTIDELTRFLINDIRTGVRD
jgi:hypothetical protein